MAGKKLLEALNEAVATDMRATIQFMWQHVMAMGMASPAVGEVFKEIAIEEMKHAESFAERLYYLGGTPTATPKQITVGGTLKEMLETNLRAEQETIKLCRHIIRLAEEEGDSTTRLLTEQILAESENHADRFETILGIRRE